MKRKITPLCTADYTQPAINIYLERLGLNGYKDAIDAALLQCEQNNVSPRQAVEQILAVIAKCRDSQKIEMLMKMARLCPAMTWENFNFSRVQTRQKKVLTELSNCHWIARGENILFYGPSGLGKTHLSVALGAKSSLFRGGFQSFRGTLHSNAPNGISFRKLWHSRFYTGYFYALQKRLETSLSGRRRLVHWLIGRSPS